MIAAIYTNQSTHIWNQAAPPTQERNVPGWSHVWKRPRETYHHATTLQIILVLDTQVLTFRHDAPRPTRPSVDLDALKREIVEEAELVLRRETEARQQADLLARQEAERVRIQRQAEDDEEVLYAASILFREPRPLTWTVHPPRRSYARRRSR